MTMLKFKGNPEFSVSEDVSKKNGIADVFYNGKKIARIYSFRPWTGFKSMPPVYTRSFRIYAKSHPTRPQFERPIADCSAMWQVPAIMKEELKRNENYSN